MKKYFLFIATSLFFYCCTAQSSNGVFCIRDTGNRFMLNKLIRTSDNGFAIVGRTSSTPRKMFFLKIDSIGNTQVVKLIGDSANWFCNDVVQTLDGGYLLSGESSATNTWIANFNVVKLDSFGNLGWSKEFIGVNDDRARSAIQLNDSNYIIVGSTNSVGYGDYDLLVIKLNKFGNLLWTKEYGGTDQDEGMKVIKTHDNGYAISGFSNSLLTGQYNCILMKFNSNDNLLWSRTVAPLPQYAICSSDLIETFDNGFACVGSLLRQQEWDNIIFKLDSLGSLQWSIVTNDSVGDFAKGIVQSSDSGFVVVGYTTATGDGYIMKCTSNGLVEWNKLIGDSTYNCIYSITTTSDGNYIAVGTSNLSVMNGNIIAKIDTYGSNCWGSTTTMDSLYFQLDTATAFQSYWSSNLLSKDTGVVSNITVSIDTICKSTTISIGENSNQDSEIIIYPNPTNNSFSVKNLSFSEISFVQIFNSLGEIVHTEKLFGKIEFKTNLNFKRGIYFVKVQDENRSVVRRLIIE